METTVYVDLFFMINFSMDFLCLFLTSKLLNIRLRALRGIVAAAFGGAYASFALFMPLDGILSMAVDAAAGVLLCAIAFFKLREWKKAPVYVLVYIAASAVLGGFMTLLFNLFNRIDLFDGIRSSEGDGISVWLFALLAILSGAVTYVGGRFFKGRMARRRVEIELFCNGMSVKLPALCDSGNLLREPISGKLCIIADISALSELIPAELGEAARKGKSFGLENLETEYRKRILMIPTSTASGEGILLGLRMDRISLTDGGERSDVDAVVALSELGAVDGDCYALIPSELLT